MKHAAEKGKDAAVRAVDKGKAAAARGAEKVKDTTDRAAEKSRMPSRPATPRGSARPPHGWLPYGASSE